MISNAFSWPIVDKSAVKFIRYRHMATQVAPETGGNFDDLFEVTNVRSETDRKLLRTWKVVGLIPDIPRPAQVLHGDQGAAKSRIAKQTAGFDRSITDAACRQRFQDYSGSTQQMV